MFAVILASEPQVVPFRLKPFDEAVHRDLNHVGLAIASHATLAVLDPTLSRKVGRLGNVKAGVEAGMIAHGERDHDLAFFLDNLKEKIRIAYQH